MSEPVGRLAADREELELRFSALCESLDICCKYRNYFMIRNIARLGGHISHKVQMLMSDAYSLMKKHHEQNCMAKWCA